MTLDDLTITGGHTDASNASGGGIRVSSANLTIVNSTVSGNDVGGDGSAGGGISAFRSTTTLTDSTVSDNGTTGFYSGGGGGIATRFGTLTLNNSRVTGNTVDGIYSEGGGINARNGTTTLIDSTVSGNITTNDGGFGGGIYAYAGTTALTNSSVNNNSTLGNFAVGAGIAAFGNTTLTNSTVRGNSATGDYNAGGGIYVADGQTTLISSTLSGNVVGNADSNSGDGGGIFTRAGGTTTVTNSIVLGNTAEDNGDETAGDITNNGSIVGGVDPASVFAALTPNGGGVSADNGGPTHTIALRNDPNNPALDAAEGAVPATDQRGVARPQPAGTEADLGAFELNQKSPPLPIGLPPVIAELDEKVAVDPALINGVPKDALAGDGGAFTVTFLSGVAAQDNAIGYYVVGEDGTIGETGFLFADATATGDGKTVETPLIEEGESLGLFLVADGADLNDPAGLAGMGFVFESRNGGAADVDFVRQPELYFADGVRVEGRVLHAVDYTEGDTGNRLNPQGEVRALSAEDEEGRLYVAFEDKAFRSDYDFNDAVLRIERANAPAFAAIGADDPLG